MLICLFSTYTGAYPSESEYGVSSYPDLTSTELWVQPEEVRPGEMVTVTSRLMNIGGSDVTSVLVGYYLSTDRYHDGNDIKIGDYTIASPVGYETHNKKMLLIPDDVPSGSYYLIKVIDPHGRIAEESKSNNFAEHPLFIARGDTPTVPESPVQPVPMPLSPVPQPGVSESDIREFSTGNIYRVMNNPTEPVIVSFDTPVMIVSIENYHWNDAQGDTPGMVGLTELYSGDKQSFGPWQAIGTPGQGGVVDAYWTVYPDIVVPAGTYTVTDSSPETWSTNEDSGYQGMTRIRYQPVSETNVPQEPVQPIITPLVIQPVVTKIITPATTPIHVQITPAITTPTSRPVSPAVNAPVSSPIPPSSARIPPGGYAISVSPSQTTAYAGSNLDYSLTIHADQTFQSPVSLRLEIDAVVTTFQFDLGRANPPYPNTIVKTIPIPSYLPGGITVTGNIIGQSGGKTEKAVVYLTIIGSGTSIPDTLVLSGAAAGIIAVGGLIGLSAAGLSSSLSGVQAAQSTAGSGSGNQCPSWYAGRVTGIIWKKERDYVWTGLPDTAVNDEHVIEPISEPVGQPIGSYQMKLCTCGAPLSEGSEFCGSCGKRTGIDNPDTEMVCNSCGHPVDKDTAFCGNCGEKIR
jgi:hypothetical protein